MRLREANCGEIRSIQPIDNKGHVSYFLCAAEFEKPNMSSMLIAMKGRIGSWLEDEKAMEAKYGEM